MCLCLHGFRSTTFVQYLWQPENKLGFQVIVNHWM